MLASVDTVFSVLDSAFGVGAEIHFRQFVRKLPTVKWMIGADFVIDEPAAAHDAFAFTIFPHHTDFTAVQFEIDQTFPKDIKGTKSVTEDMLAYLREPKRYHFCFLAQKSRHDRDTVQQARASIDRAITTIQRLGTQGLLEAEQRKSDYLNSFRRLRQEANAKGFNYKLLSDIATLSMLAATVMFWIIRHSEAELIGVFPDRDKMTLGYSGIFHDMIALNFSSLCQQFGISEKRTTLLPGPTAFEGQQMFFDPLVRMPDYVAGTLARLDYQARLVTSDHKKHADLVERFVADNTHLAIIQLSGSIIGLTASNITLWSGAERKSFLTNVRADELVEFSIAKASGFPQKRRVSYRNALLSNLRGMDETSYWLGILMRAVAAGDPGSVTFFHI